MERLTGMDSMFLSLESTTNLFHVGAVAVLDPSTAPAGSPPPHESLRLVIESRIDRIPPFRRRLLEVPAGLDHPRWVDDEPDLERHLRRGALPSPGSDTEICEFAANILSHPLDRNRPLWEIHVVEGLEGDLVAGVAKIHHSAIDGVSGAEVTAELMDLEPMEAIGTGSSKATRRERLPGPLALVRGAIPGAAARLLPAAKAVADLSMAAARIGSHNRGLETVPPPSPFQTPRTFLNSPVSAQREVALAQIDRTDVERVRHATGVTVNDVVLALTGSVLRQHLQERGELPKEPLVAFVPVSVRSTQDTLATGVNRLSGMLVSLATDVADPLIQLVSVSESSKRAKTQGQLLGPNLFTRLADLVVPAVLGPIGRLARATGLTTRWPPFNVVVSSFPGADMTLYCGGAELVAYHPLGPIVDGSALNVTAMSYKDRIGFGLLACPDVVSDLGGLARGISENMRKLTKLVST